jgi:hypothetical protein
MTMTDTEKMEFWKRRYADQRRLLNEARDAHKEQNKEIIYLRRYIREETGHEVPSRSSQ